MLTKIEMQYMDAVIGIHKEMRKANERGVDWEQRRYEIAKELFPSIIQNIDLEATLGSAVDATMKLTDLLITELQKEKK